MDASILELFNAEEILKRLTKRAATGGLHVYTSKEAANFFFEEGIIVAAAKGLVEGEDVVKLILEWNDARFSWQPEQRAPSSLKPLELHFPEYMAKLKLAPALENGNRNLAEPKPVPEAKIPAEAKAGEPGPIFISIASRASSTGPLLMSKTEEPPRPPVEVSRSGPSLIPVPSALTATKNINGSAGEDTFEKALMRKHQLALVSVDDASGPPLRIIRSSNLVGRNPACDFTMNHSSISRQHCLLQITERGLHVKDLSTTNGTKVNGINLTEGYVSVGDMLTFGHLNFMVEKDEG
jgi:hypothetical protein